MFPSTYYPAPEFMSGPTFRLTTLLRAQPTVSGPGRTRRAESREGRRPAGAFSPSRGSRGGRGPSPRVTLSPG